MRLTVIGSSGSYPGPEAPASCYHLQADHEGRPWSLLLDLGNGALGALQRHADAHAVDGVLLSHLHADHCLDLCGYYVMRKYQPSGALPKIPVWGPADTARRMAKAYDLDEDPGMTEEFDFVTYPEGTFHFGPFAISAVPVVHPVTAYALRIECEGRVLTYSGDTAVCDGLVHAARDADLFLCEASFLDSTPNPPDVHLTGGEAGTMATQAGARRVLLTHIPPWHDPATVHEEALVTYSGPMELAEPGRTYEV